MQVFMQVFMQDKDLKEIARLIIKTYELQGFCYVRCEADNLFINHLDYFDEYKETDNVQNF